MIRNLLGTLGLQKPVSASLDLLSVDRKALASLAETAGPLAGGFVGSAAGNEVLPVVGGFLGGWLGKQVGSQVGNEVGDFIRYA